MQIISETNRIHFNVAFEGSFKDPSGKSLQGRITTIRLDVESSRKSFVAQVAGNVSHATRSYLQFLTSANTSDRLVPVKRLNNLKISPSSIPHLSIKVCLNDGTLRNLRVARPANVQPGEKYTLLITHDQTDALFVELQPQITPTGTLKSSLKTSLANAFKRRVPLSPFDETKLSDAELDLMAEKDLFALFFRNNEGLLARLPAKVKHQDGIKRDDIGNSEFEKLNRFMGRINAALRRKISDSDNPETRQLRKELDLQIVTECTVNFAKVASRVRDLPRK